MQSTDFCYWLQGWFELDEVTHINADKTQIIKDHLALVIKYDKHIFSFCQGLYGMFELTGITEFNAEQTAKLKARLSETFLKDIDSRYTQNENLILDSIHLAPPSGVVYRC